PPLLAPVFGFLSPARSGARRRRRADEQAGRKRTRASLRAARRGGQLAMGGELRFRALAGGLRAVPHRTEQGARHCVSAGGEAGAIRGSSGGARDRCSVLRPVLPASDSDEKAAWDAVATAPLLPSARGVIWKPRPGRGVACEQKWSRSCGCGAAVGAGDASLQVAGAGPVMAN